MAFAATRVLEIVKKTSGGLVWKQWGMNHTRRQNAKKRARRIAQTEAILKACAESPPCTASESAIKACAELPPCTASETAMKCEQQQTQSPQ